MLAVSIGRSLLWGQHEVGYTFPTFGSLLSLLVKNAIVIAGIIFLLLLLFGGFSLIINSGSGDAKKTQQAQSAISSALVGFVVVFFAFAIVQIISFITGINILNPGF